MRLCRHAVGDVRDYVLEALRLNFRVLGMSDHAPFEELKDRSVRMMPEDYPEYLRQCNAAIEEFGDRIQILKALEIEYFTEHDAMYKKYLEDLDYLALGQHYIEDPSGMNGLKSSFGLKT
ncbi:MAG: PHP domain-containing protein, partial [Candidatus Izemoplasmatales bacterium]|nr:PHP domain-containing protein [Candidatus Izemoplasmatales bacterium]